MNAPATALSRLIPFERCFNFRDLGGYAGLDGRRVRWRRLFRSMTPEHMTDADAAHARELGLDLVVDIRGRRFQSSGPVGAGPTRRVALGSRRALGPTKRFLASFIKMSPPDALPVVLDRLAPTYARAVSLIAKAHGPVLMHCRLGKDRTGVLAAVVLKLLGVSDDDVIEDSLASVPHAAAAHNLLREMGETQPSVSRVADAPPSGAAMEAMLRRLEDAYGGARSYCLRQRISPRTLDLLVDKLLEPA